VGELALDPVAVETVFVQDCARHAAEAVGGHLVFGVAHRAEGGQDGRVAHRAEGGTVRGEDVFSASGDVSHFIQRFERLPRERDYVRAAHLHFSYEKYAARERNTTTVAMQTD
jgi:hypothetical protein